MRHNETVTFEVCSVALKAEERLAHPQPEWDCVFCPTWGEHKLLFRWFQPTVAVLRGDEPICSFSRISQSWIDATSGKCVLQTQEWHHVYPGKWRGVPARWLGHLTWLDLFSAAKSYSSATEKPAEEDAESTYSQFPTSVFTIIGMKTSPVW